MLQRIPRAKKNCSGNDMNAADERIFEEGWTVYMASNVCNIL
jgi:hypothetical protein